jgi:aminoglycoside phosphotransferase family enzyme
LAANRRVLLNPRFGLPPTLRETHMSWVFLAGDRVYKLKKPVRFPYLDFSTLERREAACRAEVSLNRRLASNVYIGVAPLAMSAVGLAIGGAGTITDWLVVMHRLNDRWALDQVLLEKRLQAPQLDRLVATLVRFYREGERQADYTNSPPGVEAALEVCHESHAQDQKRRHALRGGP